MTNYILLNYVVYTQPTKIFVGLFSPKEQLTRQMQGDKIKV